MIPNQAPSSPLTNRAPTTIVNKRAPIAPNTAVIVATTRAPPSSSIHWKIFIRRAGCQFLELPGKSHYHNCRWIRCSDNWLPLERQLLINAVISKLGVLGLDLSGNATSMIGLCQEGKSSPDALRRSAGVIRLDSSPRVCGFPAAVPIRDRTRLPFADAAFCSCSED